MLVRVATDYGKRPIRWVDAAKQRFTKELSPAQKTHFLTRMGARAVQLETRND